MPPLHDYPNLYFPLNLPFTPHQIPNIHLSVYLSMRAFFHLWRWVNYDIFFVFYFFSFARRFFSSLNILPSSASPLRKNTPSLDFQRISFFHSLILLLPYPLFLLSSLFSHRHDIATLSPAGLGVAIIGAEVAFFLGISCLFRCPHKQNGGLLFLLL